MLRYQDSLTRYFFKKFLSPLVQQSSDVGWQFFNLSGVELF